ncbi:MULTISPECIES: 2Fe-2S iron-sulfur cluster-binding protein [unclassified Microbacterium]|uniref:2Fe-2S iron-sulfur cluster-binding protein n=1 Tax=unclassified Microbacterium TaxID=2609290 RepID=UPI001E17063E|nr:MULTISPECIES: 2Fe-2S iron-sulfur cluster-binding protein [unclassified Microbacterium]MBT9607445.1 2Fe-2S iron-sulfur cluster binding domain-containing protein [Microbacterium sp.]CAH0165592.1 Putidaredoxin [Microbacterium sp. Bi128]
MTSITYVLPDGTERQVDAEDGESLMRVALQNDIPEIVGECGGELSCGTCHVFIDPAAHGVDPQSNEERDLLEMVDSATECSRLACQITVRPDLHGLRARIAGEE